MIVSRKKKISLACDALMRGASYAHLPSAKRVRNAIQNYKYGHISRFEFENEVAYSLGFNVVEG